MRFKLFFYVLCENPKFSILFFLSIIALMIICTCQSVLLMDEYSQITAIANDASILPLVQESLGTARFAMYTGTAQITLLGVAVLGLLFMMLSKDISKRMGILKALGLPEKTIIGTYMIGLGHFILVCGINFAIFGTIAMGMGESGDSISKNHLYISLLVVSVALLLATCCYVLIICKKASLYHVMVANETGGNGSPHFLVSVLAGGVLSQVIYNLR